MALRLVKLSSSFRAICQLPVRAMSDGMPGSGSGSGGGAGGSVRDSGGAFGKKQQFHEEEYFRKKQAEQLKQLHDHLHDEITYHEKEIKDHEDDIKRHKEKLQKLTDMGKEHK